MAPTRLAFRDWERGCRTRASVLFSSHPPDRGVPTSARRELTQAPVPQSGRRNAKFAGSAKARQ